MVIGIAGGVGSGKSTVLALLQRKYDACICMADQLGHKALEPETKSYGEIVREFGTGILGQDGAIDRNALAEVVYRDKERLNALNHIVHPFVKEEIQRQIAACDAKEIFVLETAILFESGCDALCDEIWGVITEDEIRICRLMESRGYSREKAVSIMNNQMSNGELAERCDKLIVNDGNMDELEKQISEKLSHQMKTRG